LPSFFLLIGNGPAVTCCFRYRRRCRYLLLNFHYSITPLQLRVCLCVRTASVWRVRVTVRTDDSTMDSLSESVDPRVEPPPSVSVSSRGADLVCSRAADRARDVPTSELSDGKLTCDSLAPIPDFRDRRLSRHFCLSSVLCKVGPSVWVSRRVCV